MNYTKYVFNEFPIVLFSRKLEMQSYEYNFSSPVDFLEISYNDSGDVTTVFEDDSSEIQKENTVVINTRPFKKVSSEGKFHRHFTVALYGHMHKEKLSPDEVSEFVQSGNHFTNNCFEFLVTDTIDDIKYAQKCKKIIQNIIIERNLPKENTLKVSGLVFSLLDVLNTYAINCALSSRNIKFSDINYCNKAINYISLRSHDEIKVADIAKDVGLSEGHISRIFKQITGNTIINYVNDVKINMIKNILTNNTATLSELSSIIGINDEKYLCRLFKKHTGMTITEFKESLKKH